MNWIEQLFGISPDGGNGTFEANLVFVAIAVFGLLGFWYSTRKSNRFEAYKERKKFFSIH